MMDENRMVELFLEAKGDNINADGILALAEVIKRKRATKGFETNLILVIRLLEELMKDVEYIKNKLESEGEK